MVKKFNIFIVNPDNGKFETIEEWKKSPNPQKAELVAIKDINDFGLLISKSLIKDDLGVLKVDFDDAVKLASGYKPTTVYPIDRTVEGAFRLPTRRECLDVYDARFQRLNDALRLIGGDPLTDNWIWTGDEDPNPKCNSYHAFIFGGSYGNVGNYGKDNTFAVRPFSAFLPF